MTTPVLATDIPGLPRLMSGKVRDVYDLGDSLLLVATDRISAYDVVMPNGIPDKGRVLTQVSRFWFLQLRPFVGNHYITADIDYIAARLSERRVNLTPDLRKQLSGRTTLVLKAQVFPVECVVRGYLAGSLWNEYVAAGGQTSEVTVHGIPFPSGLQESERLPQPIFTPATKAETGHDQNISVAEMTAIVGTEDAKELQRVSIDIYRAAAERTLSNGIILADTKFEFGIHKGSLMLVDEVLTPDSSRFWDLSTYKPGRSQPSFDKQFVRDWLSASGWNKEPPAPELPADVVAGTAARYREAYRRIVGEPLPEARA
jgi:phosphoribosylaminoimidazole-succinocarboxamide synthase